MHVAAVESSKAAHRACTPTCIRTTHLRSHTQQTRSTEKDEDVNWVRTNLRTEKNHSAEGETLCGSCTIIPRLAARKLYGICTECTQNAHRFAVEFVGFCKVPCDMYHMHADLAGDVARFGMANTYPKCLEAGDW